MAIVNAAVSGRRPSDIPNFQKIFPKFDNRRQRFLSKTEAVKLFSFLESSEEWYAIAMFALHTGLRRGEIFNIHRSHVNYDERLLAIPNTKSGVNRIIPLNDIAAKIISKHMQKVDRRGLLFLCVAPKTFSRAVDKSGLNDGIIDTRQRVVFHTLRHTFASWLVQDGVPLVVVSQLLGHSSLNMTMRYAHLDPLLQARQAVAQLNERFDW